MYPSGSCIRYPDTNLRTTNAFVKINGNLAAAVLAIISDRADEDQASSVVE